MWLQAAGASHGFSHVDKGFNIPLVSQSLYSLMPFAGHERSLVAGCEGKIMNRDLFQIIKIRSCLVIYQGVWKSNRTLFPICFRARVGALQYKIITDRLITRKLTESRSNPHMNLHQTFASFSFFTIIFSFWCLKGGKKPLIKKKRGGHYF